jgi:hypothetical protein
MRHVPDANPFKVKDQYPGASAIVRRALSQVNVESPTIKRILAACAKLKLKCVAPHYLPAADEWAHIGIPEKKVVIFLTATGDPRKVNVKREAWAGEGWGLLSVEAAGIDRTTDNALPLHLKAAIEEVMK